MLWPKHTKCAIAHHGVMTSPSDHAMSSEFLAEVSTDKWLILWEIFSEFGESASICQILLSNYSQVNRESACSMTKRASQTIICQIAISKKLP